MGCTWSGGVPGLGGVSGLGGTWSWRGLPGMGGEPGTKGVYLVLGDTWSGPAGVPDPGGQGGEGVQILSI